jgi:ribosomal protein L14E/L6E/L27E
MGPNPRTKSERRRCKLRHIEMASLVFGRFPTVRK